MNKLTAILLLIACMLNSMTEFMQGDIIIALSFLLLVFVFAIEILTEGNK